MDNVDKAAILAKLCSEYPGYEGKGNFKQTYLVCICMTKSQEQLMEEVRSHTLSTCSTFENFEVQIQSSNQQIRSTEKETETLLSKIQFSLSFLNSLLLFDKAVSLIVFLLLSDRLDR